MGADCGKLKRYVRFRPRPVSHLKHVEAAVKKLLDIPSRERGHFDEELCLREADIELHGRCDGTLLQVRGVQGSKWTVS